jgi:hypothetical protein
MRRMFDHQGLCRRHLSESLGSINEPASGMTVSHQRAACEARQSFDSYNGITRAILSQSITDDRPQASADGVGQQSIRMPVFQTGRPRGRGGAVPGIAPEASASACPLFRSLGPGDGAREISHTSSFGPRTWSRPRGWPIGGGPPLAGLVATHLISPPQGQTTR